MNKTRFAADESGIFLTVLWNAQERQIRLTSSTVCEDVERQAEEQRLKAEADSRHREALAWGKLAARAADSKLAMRAYERAVDAQRAAEALRDLQRQCDHDRRMERESGTRQNYDNERELDRISRTA